MASRTQDTRLSKGEQTRQAIEAAAYDLIIRQGYAATSMRQIAERAGLAPGSIYNHFASKEAVFRAIIERRHPFFQIVPLLNSVPGMTVEEYVHNAANRLVDELGKYPEFLNLMLVEIVEFKAAHAPLLIRKVLPELMPIAQHLGELEGNVRAIPPFVLARAFLGMFFSYYITQLFLSKALPRELRQANAIDYFAQIFLHGILSEEGV